MFRNYIAFHLVHLHRLCCRVPTAQAMEPFFDLADEICEVEKWFQICHAGIVILSIRAQDAENYHTCMTNLAPYARFAIQVWMVVLSIWVMSEVTQNNLWISI